MKTLLAYEIKKIVMKKSNIVAFVLLFAVQILLAFSGSLGSSYVDGVFLETHMERNKINRENGIALSGRAVEEELLTEMQEAYAKVELDENEQYLFSEVYQNEVRKYSNLAELLQYWGAGSSFLSEDFTEEMLYELREAEKQELWEYYELSQKEQEYWQEKEAELEIPFTYEYATAYEYLLGMHGAYMICLIFTFFIAIAMVNVFVEEHNRKTDQLLLCTKWGRGRIYIAKIAAGSIVIFASNVLFLLAALAGNFFSYGSEGFTASLQMIMLNWYSYPMSVGKALWICIGLLLLSSVMTAVFAMVLAEVLKNAIAAMAIIIAGSFASRLILLPPAWGVVSQLWNYLPLNLLKIDQGFADLRLVSVFGAQLTIWQFAPILYVLITAVLIWIGLINYKNYQVSGR